MNDRRDHLGETAGRAHAARAGHAAHAAAAYAAHAAHAAHAAGRAHGGQLRNGVLAASCVAAAPAALVTAAPSALRLSGGPPGLLVGWALVAGLLVFPLLLATAVARRARRALVDDASTTTVRLVFGAALALALAVPVHAVAAVTLKVHTHHRALGGTAFAVLALAVYAVLWALGYRIAALVSDGDVRGDKAVSERALREAAAGACAVALALGAVASVMLRETPIGSAAPLRERALLLDMALALAGVAVGGFVAGPRARRAGWAAWAALAAAVVVGGGALLAVAKHPELASAVEAQAPLAAAWTGCLHLWE